MNKRLVILGAGIGGLSVIKELRESGVPLNDLDITIVDEDLSHFLGFTLPWVMRGWRRPRQRSHPPQHRSIVGNHHGRRVSPRHRPRNENRHPRR